MNIGGDTDRRSCEHGKGACTGPSADSQSLLGLLLLWLLRFGRRFEGGQSTSRGSTIEPATVSKLAGGALPQGRWR